MAMPKRKKRKTEFSGASLKETLKNTTAVAAKPEYGHISKYVSAREFAAIMRWLKQTDYKLYSLQRVVCDQEARRTNR